MHLPALSKRIANLQLSETYAILDMVRELRTNGENVIDLGGGEPDFDTPEHVVSAAIAALASGDTHYTPSRGKKELLQAVAEKYQREHGLLVDADRQIIVTPSAKHALFIALMTLLDEGDEVIIPTPSWVSYKAMAVMAGATAKAVPLDGSKDFRLDVQALERAVTPRSKAILINNPNNPTGRVLTREEIEGVIDLATRHGLYIVADEIYDKVIYGEATHISIASLEHARPLTITVGGFSKAYAMTGWRLGYVVAPEAITQEMLKVQQHTVGCAGSFIQHGGIAALQGCQGRLSEMVHTYRQRRDRLIAGLESIPGLKCIVPKGALYIFASIADLGFDSSVTFTRWLLSTAKVAVTPGTAFGEGGEGYIRLSFAGSDAAIDEAIVRLQQAFR
ncbi:pyridoxal phosphate-dependent aminotransferase [Pseudomonas japonica]|uniref:pyridoxal phosphate-dependent aminotransferase n=1 Tax=Pseudomonas japonica TaxID=256466 RepID=UPI0038169D52